MNTRCRHISWLPLLAVLLVTTWLQPACALAAPQPAPTPGAAAPGASSLTVAVAANARPLFETVLPQFQQATGITARASYAASGNLYAQITNGAPYDIFFSADVTYPKRLEAEGYAAPDSVQTYALGKIVLWAPNAGKLDVARLQGAGSGRTTGRAGGHCEPGVGAVRASRGRRATGGGESTMLRKTS